MTPTPERRRTPLPMLETVVHTPEKAAALHLIKTHGVPRNRAERRRLVHTLRKKGR